MKYSIETMIGTIAEDDKEDIKEILFGEPYDVITFSEGGELIDDEKKAIEEFKSLSATARRQADGTIEIRIPELVRGEEELAEDILEKYGEEVYMVMEYEVVDTAEFDEESLQLFRDLGYKV